MLKSFQEFLNESTSKSIFHFEPRFPWDQEILDTLGEIESTIKSVKRERSDWWWERSQGAGSPLGSNETASFNIKVHDWPDIEKLSADTGISTEELENDWNMYLEDTAKMFMDDLDFSWIQDSWISGRSGGWLTVKVDSDWAPDSVEEYARGAISGYMDSVESIEGITDDEKKEMRGAFAAKKFGMSGRTLSDERAEELKGAEEVAKKCLKTLTENLEAIKEVEAGLEQIAKWIDEGKKTLVQDFEDSL